MTIEEIQACKKVKRSIARAYELETKGSAIPSFHIYVFILKATLMAEWKA